MRCPPIQERPHASATRRSPTRRRRMTSSTTVRAVDCQSVWLTKPAPNAASAVTTKQNHHRADTAASSAGGGAAPPARRQRGCSPDNPLVVRAAVSAERTRFPIPLSIRACGFPAHGFPMVFWTWLPSLRVADSATKPMQAVPVEPLSCPLIGLSRTQITAPLLKQKPFKPPHDVPIDLDELDSGVAGTKIIAPAAQDRIELRDHVTDVSSDPIAAGAVANLGP